MKNIGIYCCDYYPNQSGYSYAFQALIRGLIEADKECIIDVFTAVQLNEMPELDIERVRIIRCPSNSLLPKIKPFKILEHVIFKAIRISRIINYYNKYKNYTCFIFESIEEPLILSLLSKRILRKSIVRIHATSETEYALWGGGIYQAFRKKLIKHHLKRSIQNIAATADYYLDFVKKWYLEENQILIASKNFAVIPNALLNLPDVSVKNFNEKGSVRHFVTLGRMDVLGTNQKGFDDIIGAIDLLNNNEKKLIKITFIGTGSERGRLIHKADKIKNVNFEFIEKVKNDDVGKILIEADAVILASRYEGMSIFAMEALAYGAPVIYSNAGGIQDLVKLNGLTYMAGDKNQLSNCLSNFLEFDVSKLKEMSGQSVKIISELTTANIGKKFIYFANNL